MLRGVVSVHSDYILLISALIEGLGMCAFKHGEWFLPEETSFRFITFGIYICGIKYHEYVQLSPGTCE